PHGTGRQSTDYDRTQPARTIRLRAGAAVPALAQGARPAPVPLRPDRGALARPAAPLAHVAPGDPEGPRRPHRRAGPDPRAHARLARGRGPDRAPPHRGRSPREVPAPDGEGAPEPRAHPGGGRGPARGAL